MREIIIFSLGGSLIVPRDIDVNFLREFRKFIIKNLKKYKFIIVTGGGNICREYIRDAEKINRLPNVQKDWIGIQITQLNSQLIYSILHDLSPNRTLDPTKYYHFKNILVAGGWKPGSSTDYDTVLLAKNYNIKTIINMTNTNYIYNKDPSIRGAKLLTRLSWRRMEQLVKKKRTPGMHTPFDPTATKLAGKLKLRLISLNGRNVKNLQAFLDGKPFIGTIVE